MAEFFDDRFIDRVYDAATVPALWSDLLVEIADNMRSALGIACGMPIEGQGTIFCHYGRCAPPDDNELGRRHLINPWTLAVQQQPTGRILPSHEILSLRDLRRTEFYSDILAPEKVDHCLISTACRRKNISFTFSIMRGENQGAYSKTEIAKLQALMPHLRRSAQMRLNFEAYKALSIRQQQVLDQINTGIILIDDMEQYHCINLAAEEIVQGNNGLILVNQSLTASDLRASRRLSDLVAATIAGGAGGSLAIPREAMFDPLLVLVCPLRGMIREMLSPPSSNRQTVALFIKDPIRGFSGLDDVLGPLFRLTQAETRVALALGSGQSVGVVACRLGISQNTVKTHAKRIYEKMGVTNHAELVKKLSRLASF